MPAVPDVDQTDDEALRAVRPPSATRLERRLAAASILDAWHGESNPVRIGRLQVQRKLGEGAMGVVYEAHDPELDRTVAVKVLRTEADQRERERVTGEARALARLSHPCVVTVFDISSSDGDLFLSMEYVPGGTLKRFLDEHPEAPWHEIVNLFVQAAQGLAAAHEAGVVHQDFKPENVLVGADGRVKVADFGLAHVEVEHDQQGAKSVRFVGGTPRYMAPELELGSAATPKSDQYSFCVALREAFDDGRFQFVPARLHGIVARGLQQDPAERWPSMRALADALARVATPRPDDRHRGALLDRVERLWVSGVLAESLRGRPALSLAVVDAHEQVVPPWADFGADPFAERAQRTTADLPDLLRQSQQSLLILGALGAGKTTALLGLTEALLQAAWRDAAEPAPVVLNLASFDPKRCSLVDWVIGELVTKYSLPARWGAAWLEQDALVLLLDGLDEVPSARRADVAGAIDAFRRDHPVPTVVACREDAYLALGTKLRFGAAVVVQPLDDDQVERLLRDAEAEALADALQMDSDLRAQLRSPLMLDVLAASGAELAGCCGEEVWSVLYREYVAHALARREVGRHPPQRIVDGLSWLARAMRRLGTTDLWLERLQASWLERGWQRRAARWIGTALIAVATLSIAVGAQLLVGLEPVSTWVLSAAAVGVVLVLLRSAQVRPVEALQPSWRRGVRWLPLTLGLGVVTGSVMGLRGLVFGANAVPGDLTTQLVGNIVTGAFMGAAGAAVLGLEPADHEARVRPNRGIAQSLRTALLVGIPSALVVGVVFGYVAIPLIIKPLAKVHGPWLDHWAMSVRHGVLFGTAMFFIFGGAAVTLHWVVRVAIVLASPLPLRLVGFLEEAADRGLLRRVGGGYMFPHRTLLDYFAGLSRDEPAEPQPGP